LWEAHEQVTEILGKKDDDVVEMSTTTTTGGNDNDSVENAENDARNSNSNNSINKDQQQQKQPDGKPTRSVAVSSKATAPTTNTIGSVTTAPTTTTTTASNSTTTNENNNNIEKPDTIHIDVLDGYYGGSFYDLQPKSRIFSWVGRSQGKKFKQKGISLPKDLEISTTHGRFGYSSRAGGSFSYTDVGSTNGSRINGSCCEPNVSYELTTGMEILIGETLLKVTLLALA